MTVFLSEYADLQLLQQDGTRVRAREAVAAHAYVLVYFAAHSVPACQRLTLVLADFYLAHARRHNFTVLFVSHDRLERHMLDFFYNRRGVYVPHKQPRSVDAPLLSSTSQQQQQTPRLSPLPSVRGQAPWLALPFAEYAVARALQRRYRVSSVPALALVDVATSRVLSYAAMAHLRNDPDALRFPWVDEGDDDVDNTRSSISSTTAMTLVAAVRAALRWLAQRVCVRRQLATSTVVAVVAVVALVVFLLLLLLRRLTR